MEKSKKICLGCGFFGGEYEVEMDKCQKCSGTGVSEHKACDSCHGLGNRYYSLTWDERCPDCGLELVLPGYPHRDHEWSRHTIKKVICKQCGKMLDMEDYLAGKTK